MKMEKWLIGLFFCKIPTNCLGRAAWEEKLAVASQEERAFWVLFLAV